MENNIPNTPRAILALAEMESCEKQASQRKNMLNETSLSAAAEDVTLYPEKISKAGRTSLKPRQGSGGKDNPDKPEQFLLF